MGIFDLGNCNLHKTQNKIMKSLYYTKLDDTTFWIPGYARQGPAVEQIKNLEELLNTFVNELKIGNVSDVMTLEINEYIDSRKQIGRSARYRFMQVFFIKGRFDHPDLFEIDKHTFNQIIHE